MTVEQAALIKGCTRQAVFRAIWNGSIHAVRFGRRAWNVTNDRRFQNWQPTRNGHERMKRAWVTRRLKRKLIEGGVLVGKDLHGQRR